ncbi:MAG: ABC-type transport auxiliary lipoprotein family protein [Pseudoxanthomonas sp.]
MKPNATTLSALAAACLIVLLPGCSVLGGAQRDPVTIYSPQIDIPADPSWPMAHWQLVVLKPTAARVVDSPRIAVRPTPDEIQVYKGVTWSQPATDLLESLLLRGFEDSGKIESVARPGTGIRQDYKLLTDVRRFESDYAGASTPSALMEINAKLVHATDQRVVASRTFLQREPANSAEVGAVVAAFERGLGKLGAEMVGWTLATGEADVQRKP